MAAQTFEFDTRDPKFSKVILLAGEPSNNPGQHEYIADCAAISDWLKLTPRIWPVLVRTWPTNEAIFNRAKCVVILMDGGAKSPLLLESRWTKLNELTAAGVGYVALHQAVDYPVTHADDAKRTLGGVWTFDIGCRGHWDMELKPIAGHPVLRGVKSFAAPADGWLYNLHFAEDPGFTPLLAGAVPDKSRTTIHARQHAGRDEIVAWAYERKGGGRSVGFTGVDLHKNWEIENQRRFVVNAILWSAGHEVPRQGAPVDLRPGQLERYVRSTNAPSQKN